MPLLDSIAVDHLADAVLVITGGTNGIGLALAKRLLSLEGRVKGVVICSRSQENVDKAVKEIGDDRIRGKAGDVTDFQQTVAVMKYAVDTFGSIDYVFANAGATGWFVADFSKEPSEPDVSVTLDMVKGLANTVHAAAPLMQTQSAGRQSKDKAIIISGSDASFINFSLNPTYAMAKHAMNGAAYSYAEWLRPIGIRISTIAMNMTYTAATNFLDASVFPGGIESHEWITMEKCIDTYMQALGEVQKTGTVLRVTGPHHEPREYTCEFSTIGSIDRWLPPFAKNEAKRKQLETAEKAAES